MTTVLLHFKSYSADVRWRRAVREAVNTLNESPDLEVTLGHPAVGIKGPGVDAFISVLLVSVRVRRRRRLIHPPLGEALDAWRDLAPDHGLLTVSDDHDGDGLRNALDAHFSDEQGFAVSGREYAIVKDADDFRDHLRDLFDVVPRASPARLLDDETRSALAGKRAGSPPSLSSAHVGMRGRP